MIYRFLGILILAAAGSAIIVYIILLSRKPEMKKPTVGALLTFSGLVMFGVGLMLAGNPIAPILMAMGIVECIIGLVFYVRGGKVTSK